MNKSELIKVLADEENISADEAAVIVSTFFDSVREALVDDDRVEIRGFGSFKTKDYKSYVGRNPKTGDSVTVPSKKLPVFRAGKELRELLNE